MGIIVRLGLNVHEMGLVIMGVFWKEKTTSIGETFLGRVFSSFFAKPGAEKGQLGVFGQSGAIVAIYFSFLAL
jgi:hypothetical protein